MIKKIKNLKLSKSQRQLDNEWIEIKSLRNKLLKNSDWIFVPDNNLDEDNISLWIIWRQNVRDVNMITHADEALKYLLDLQNNKPPVKYKLTEHSSLSIYKLDLRKLLNKLIKQTVDKIHDDMESREILSEQFDEAIRFLEGKIENNFLIELEASHSKMTHTQVAEKFIEQRKTYYIKLVNIEQVKNNLITRIDVANDLETCKIVHQDILKLGSKKWI